MCWIGLTKSIGVSYFNSQTLMNLYSYAKNKVEMNLLFKGLINNMKIWNNIVFMTFYPYCIGKRRFNIWKA